MDFIHSHIILNEKCKGRTKCIKSCPTQALRYRNNKVVFFDDLCVDCGECINVCPENVFIPVVDEISDFEKFEYKIAIPSLVLYSQFNADVHPLMIHETLKNVGFDEIVDISPSINVLSYTLSEYIKKKTDGKPIIGSFCPSVIRLIQVNYPNLMELISPFDVTREITAKEAKKRISEEKGISIDKIGAIYLTPCPAKVVSIKQPAEKETSWINGAISISDIYKIIHPEILKMKTQSPPKKYDGYFFYAKGGMLNQVLQHFDSEKCLSVMGIDNIKMILDDIEDSKLVNIDYLEAYTCAQGCLGGAFCVENPYISRHNSHILRKNFGTALPINKKVIDEKYKQGHYFMENKLMPRKTRVLSTDLVTSIKRMKQKERILSKLPKKDCGLCGAPSCETFAQDCSLGEADLSDCIFLNISSHY